jgi:hypothetical protein
MIRSAVSLAAALTLVAGAAGADPTRIPLDQSITVGGIDVACTGIGQTKSDPKWQAYPVRVEFADPHQAYLANETLSLADAKGHELLQVSCEGPWVLLKLPVGKSFKVTASLADQPAAPRTASVRAPAHGQARFVIVFPDAQ